MAREAVAAEGKFFKGKVSREKVEWGIGQHRFDFVAILPPPGGGKPPKPHKGGTCAKLGIGAHKPHLPEIGTPPVHDTGLGHASGLFSTQLTTRKKHGVTVHCHGLVSSSTRVRGCWPRCAGARRDRTVMGFT